MPPPPPQQQHAQAHAQAQAQAQAHVQETAQEVLSTGTSAAPATTSRLQGHLLVNVLRSHMLLHGQVFISEKNLARPFLTITFNEGTVATKPFESHGEEASFDEHFLLQVDHPGQEKVFIRVNITLDGKGTCVGVYHAEVGTLISHVGPQWLQVRSVGSFAKEKLGVTKAELLVDFKWFPYRTDVPTDVLTKLSGALLLNKRDIKRYGNLIASSFASALDLDFSAEPGSGGGSRGGNGDKGGKGTGSGNNSLNSRPSHSTSESGGSSTPSHAAAAAAPAPAPASTSTSAASSSSASSTAAPSQAPHHSRAISSKSSSSSKQGSSSSLPTYDDVVKAVSRHVLQSGGGVTSDMITGVQISDDQTFLHLRIPPTPFVFSSPPYGRILPDTKSFDDRNFLEHYAGISHVHELMVWGDDTIEAIQVIFKVAGARVPAPRRGKRGHNVSILSLADDEYIVGIAGRQNHRGVTGLTVVTTQQRRGFGCAPCVEMGEDFACTLPAGSRVVCFHGGFNGSMINHLGVCYQRIATFELGTTLSST